MNKVEIIYGQHLYSPETTVLETDKIPGELFLRNTTETLNKLIAFCIYIAKDVTELTIIYDDGSTMLINTMDEHRGRGTICVDNSVLPIIYDTCLTFVSSNNEPHHIFTAPRVSGLFSMYNGHLHDIHSSEGHYFKYQLLIECKRLGIRRIIFKYDTKVDCSLTVTTYNHEIENYLVTNTNGSIILPPLNKYNKLFSIKPECIVAGRSYDIHIDESVNDNLFFIFMLSSNVEVTVINVTQRITIPDVDLPGNVINYVRFTDTDGTDKVLETANHSAGSKLSVKRFVGFEDVTIRKLFACMEELGVTTFVIQEREIPVKEKQNNEGD